MIPARGSDYIMDNLSDLRESISQIQAELADLREDLERVLPEYNNQD